MEGINRLIQVDQRPIGRTPRSNLATYTGLFDQVRSLFAATPTAQARRYNAGRFSFNVAKGRCPECEGEGFVMVELLFLPSVYAPCPVCHGTRYNDETLEVRYQGKNIAEVLGMTVDAAWEFFDGVDGVRRSLGVLRKVGAGYLRLGQPATELSGGEAQRIKLATELQRNSGGRTLYVLDEPDDGPASGRCRTAGGTASGAGGARQHGGRRGARPARDGGERLDPGCGSGGRRRWREGGRSRAAQLDPQDANEPDGPLSRPVHERQALVVVAEGPGSEVADRQCSEE